MAFSMDEVWVYNGQHIVAEPFTTPTALGVGSSKVKWSSFIQGPLQTGKVGAFGSATATQMIGRTDTISTPLALNTRGNVTIEGDGGTANGLKLSGGSSVDALYVNGDAFFTGAVDCGNKGKLAARFSSADARPKPFDIQHPTKGEGHRLRYACIEGPEVGVYCRGRVRNEKIIKLPYYWKDLVDVESISVQLQPIGAHQDVIVKRWDAETVYLQANGGLPINCFYHVYGERKDINPLIVEYEGDSWKDYPDPNFNPDTASDPEDPNRFNDPNYRGRRNTITI
tara:strand:- start:494 stop:1342 length:849 start_codon:yes stop_codon:yes gene_type:complete